MLVESVPAEHVKWGWKLASVQETTSSGSGLSFRNGEVLYGFDLLVGADGTWSKTRSLLLQDRPHNFGLGGWSMQVSNAQETAPEAHAFLGDGRLNVSCYGPYPEDFTKHFDFNSDDLGVAKQYMLKELVERAPQLRNLTESANEGLVWHNLYELPVGWTWSHKRGVTLLGDVAHLMIPFAGIGVNKVFYDAMEFAKQIVAFSESKEHTDVDAYIVCYEKIMFKHAYRAQTLTEGCKTDTLLTPGAPRPRIEPWILGHIKGDTQLGRTHS